MTPDRQNEIWAMLPNDFKEFVVKTYNETLEILNRVRYDEDFYAYSGRLSIYNDIFGEHNLAAQAEEKPKERTCTQTYTDNCSSQNPVDWNRYRLDLAKKIAVAMIPK